MAKPGAQELLPGTHVGAGAQAIESPAAAFSGSLAGSWIENGGDES